MDPISAAGIGLSVVSLAFQLFAGCVKAYHLFSEMTGMPENFEYLRVRLRLEQSRLLDWGDKIGLLEETLEGPSATLQLHRNLIVDILLAVQTLFKGCLKIESDFGTIQSTMDISMRSSLQNTNSPSGNQSGRRLDKLLSKTMKILSKTQELPRRLEWALVKQDHFQALVEKLISYNDSIVSLLDRVDLNRLVALQLQSQLTLLQLCVKVEDLSRLSKAVLVEPQPSTPSLTGRTLASGAIDGKSAFSRLLNFKAYYMKIESSSIKNVQLLDRKDIALLDDEPKTLAKYKDRTVWIEWKDYDPDHPQPGWVDMIEDRVKRLVALLSLDYTPVEFRAPNCIGFFDDCDTDDPRYGIVYSIPDGVSPLAKPITLRRLIETRSKPSLTQRVALALSISQGMTYLHAVDWLHKSFRSENIVYFIEEGQEPPYSMPTLCGLDYARPDLPDEMTERPVANLEHDVYRHPDALGGDNVRSKKSWDIYSLGIVLIEIACWQVIDDLMLVRKGQGSSARRIRNMRESFLIGGALGTVGSNAGERYHDVVQCCLEGGSRLGIAEGSNESDSTVGANILQAMADNVVDALKSLQI